MKLYFYAKDGYYVETIIGRPITNFIRLLLHTRRISTKPMQTRVKPGSMYDSNSVQCKND